MLISSQITGPSNIVPGTEPSFPDNGYNHDGKSHLKKYTLIRNIVYIVLLIGFLILLFDITLQIAYPVGVSRPNTFVGSKKLSMNNQAHIVRYLEESKPQFIIQASNAEPLEIISKAAGLTVDNKKTVAWATDYPLKARLVPFSLWVRRERELPHFNVDDKKLVTFSKKIEQILSTDPINASIAIEKENVIVVPEKVGQKVIARQVEDSVKDIVSTGTNIAKIPVYEAKPLITQNTLSSTKAQAEALLNKKISVQAGQHQEVVSRQHIADWIEFELNSDNNSMNVVLNKEEIKGFLDTLRRFTDEKAAASTVLRVDGESRVVSNGTPGKSLNINQSADTIIAALKGTSKEAKVVASVDPIQPPTYFSTQYSQSPAGLAALLNDILSKRTYKVTGAVRVLNKDNWYAGYGDTEAVVTASIYKIYIAQVLFEYIEDGRLSWDSTVATGQTINTCFERMIVISEDRCTIAIAQMMGWSTIDNRLLDLGYTSTKLDNYTNNAWKVTSARDQVLFLERLHAGTFGSQSNRDKLLDAMKRQIYRKGIPEGAKPAVVADKVGWYGKYLNDSGIVYGKNNTYAISILTSNGSWKDIAQITSEIDTFLNNK